MAVKILNVTITPTTPSVNAPITVVVDILDNDWYKVKVNFSEWKAINELFTTWDDLKAYQ